MCNELHYYENDQGRDKYLKEKAKNGTTRNVLIYFFQNYL